MLSVSRRQIVFSAAVLLFAFVAVAWETRAQSLPATAHTPDLLGIYPGMPGPAARAMLQKHSSTINVKTLQQASMGFQLTIPDQNREMVTVYLTQEPNDPPTVWMIQRSQGFLPANPMSKDTLLAALRQKYGKETLTSDRGGVGLYLYWIFDQGGKLLTTADERLKGCSGGPFVTFIGRGPDHGSADLDACYRSFFAVAAALNYFNSDLLQAYQVELVNLPYAVAAATVTMNANNKAADQARRDQENKANQNKPTF
jgi:hypothetical protein